MALLITTLLFAIWVIIICLGVCLGAEYKLFKKAGVPGWGVFIPFYNLYLLMLIVWGNGWLWLIMFIPGANIVFTVATYIKLARVFGYGVGFGVAMVLFPVICIPILGFSSNRYLGPDNKGLKWCLIGSISVFIIWLIVTGLVISMGTTSKVLSNAIREDSEMLDWEDEVVYTNDDDRLGTSESVELDNNHTKVTIPFKRTSISSVAGNYATSTENGVSVEILYESVPEVKTVSDLVPILDEEVSSQVRVLEGLSEWYTEVTKDSSIENNESVYQVIRYTSTQSGNPCFKVIKVEKANEYPLITKIEVNRSIEYEDTDDYAKELLDLYNIKL